MNNFNLEQYLSCGIQNLVKDIMKISNSNTKQKVFMAKHLIDSTKAQNIRHNHEQDGTHIPPFLIASITSKCNLHCAGCYARANHSCYDGKSNGLLSTEDWNSIFEQAQKLGIEFVLLAGGEPFVRRDVLIAAGKNKKLLFPIFTNGTMIDDDYIKLLDSNRNLIPMFSVEGDKQATDMRRGDGVYNKVYSSMKKLNNFGIIFGASITVTKNNIKDVLSTEFLDNLNALGTKAVIFVEYVPISADTNSLALDDSDREYMDKKIHNLRISDYEMILLSFPGDEKLTGGCLAAGRGFFHINPTGSAEPCPFSPYSDTNIKNTTLLNALQSPLFVSLQRNGNLTDEHIGGCTLFAQKDKVEKILEQSTL